MVLLGLGAPPRARGGRRARGARRAFAPTPPQRPFWWFRLQGLRAPAVAAEGEGGASESSGD